MRKVNFKQNRHTIVLSYLIAIILSGCYTLWQIDEVYAKEIQLENKIVFLKDGDVWLVDQSSRNTEQITNTKGKVEDFYFSPSLRYLAYYKILKYIEEPGIWENEEAPMVAVWSIVIMDLKNQKILKEIKPHEQEWLYIDTFLPTEKLLFHDSDSFAVGSYHEYDIVKNATRELDYEEARQLGGTDFHEDGSQTVYISEENELHIKNLKSAKDKVVSLKGRDFVSSPTISHNKEYVALLEVTIPKLIKHGTEKISDDNKDRNFDFLWVYNIKEDRFANIYKEPVRPKSGFKLSWSFGDRFIAMAFPSPVIVVDTQNPKNVFKIGGMSFNWISDNKFIFAEDNDVYLYDMDTQKKELFLKDASKPVFLKRMGKVQW